MSVSHLASSESHTGTAGSTLEPSFTWPHTPGGTARGVTVAVWTNSNAGVSQALGVTYDGVTVPAVSGGEASRTTGEAGNVKIFHLGSGVPAASPATVVVTRTNAAPAMWACCVTQAASAHTEVHTAGIVLTQSGGIALAERSVDDGTPGTASLRYAAGHYGFDTVPPAGPNSTLLHGIDIGVQTASMVRETVAGQGSRLVGSENAAVEELAIVSFAVRELPGVPTVGVSHLASSESHTGTTGSTFEPSFTWAHTPGGTPNGVTIFVSTHGNVGVSQALGVTYAGVTVPAMVGAEASRTTGEAGNCKVFHLGSGIPAASPATVVVTRTDNAVQMWACCVTQLAPGDTEIVPDTIELRMGASGILEVPIADGASSSESLRYAGGFFGNDIVPTVGANSVEVESIDLGSMTSIVVREQTPGQGVRSVGFDDATADEKAVVHFAVRAIVAISTDLFVMVYGALSPQSPIGELPLPGAALTKVVTPEALHLAEVYSVLRLGPSTLIFIASPNHASVTEYTAELWPYPVPGANPIDTQALGVPTPDAFGHIAVNLTTLYTGQAAGEYTVTVLTTTLTGSARSDHSDAFTLPLL